MNQELLHSGVYMPAEASVATIPFVRAVTAVLHVKTGKEGC